ncbi:hypothetical protein [Geomonas sp.]|uniref:hypothetical protein n=1 Tax=Geomonas sp. TaxID=2651584 RepID=UPI002B484710|nr:hypothetical protein [Geomonas sp.]HJV36386.1 hypothetical protein [Geomonas sp.]
MTTNDQQYRIDLSADDYQAAFTEVAFLMDAFASTVDNIMGGVTAPVGRIAGREMAAKLPVHLRDPALPEVARLLAERMQAGFEFALEEKRLTFGRCVIRDVCELRGMESGGALCRLFHAYLDGVMDGLLYRPIKSELVSAGKRCVAELETL